MIEYDFVYDKSVWPPCFLPIDIYNDSSLLDVTSISDEWRRYATNDGHIHDCLEYFHQWQNAPQKYNVRVVYSPDFNHRLQPNHTIQVKLNDRQQVNS